MEELLRNLSIHLIRTKRQNYKIFVHGNTDYASIIIINITPVVPLSIL